MPAIINYFRVRNRYYRGLKIVKNNLRDKNIKNFIEKTIIGLNEGENLSAIWQKNFNLPAYLISSINIAEHTGLLAEA